MKFFLVLLMVAFAHSRLAPLIQMPEKVDGSYIIVLEDSADIDEFVNRFETDVAKIGERPVLRHILRVALKAVAADFGPDALQLVRTMDDVKYVEENAVAHMDGTVSWGTDRINQRTGTDGNDEMYGTGKGANIYIIDSGIRWSHVDFGGRAFYGKDFVDDDSFDGWDCDGHGTHCAGSAAGLECGVAKEANVWSVRVFDCEGRGTTVGVNGAIDYVASQARAGRKYVVASMSLSVSGISNSMTDAVYNAIDAGVVVVTSSGNGATDGCSLTPGYIDEVITVGNTEKDDTIRYSSNYGSCVSILAPGTSIVSASHLSDTGAATMTGTSMACPHVAGAAAVLMADRGVSPFDVQQQLISLSTKNEITFDYYQPYTPNRLLYLPRW